MLDDFELLDAQVEALFTHDRFGRIQRVNEPGGRRAPRLFLGRTRQGNLWRFRDDLPEDLVARLAPILSAEPVASNLPRDPRCLDALRAILNDDQRIRHEFAGPAYHFPNDLPIRGDSIAITPENADLLRPGFAYLIPELLQRQPCVAVARNGAAVAVCFSSRLSTRVAEAGVETLADFRGRGYASAVTSAWALAVRQRRLCPLYSTSWQNLASQGVARHLGLVQYGVDLSITEWRPKEGVRGMPPKVS